MPVKKALRPAVQLCLGEVVHEDRAFLPDAVDIGRFPDHQPAVVDARLHPADVVAHDEQNVGFARCCGPVAAQTPAHNQHRGGKRREQTEPDLSAEIHVHFLPLSGLAKRELEPQLACRLCSFGILRTNYLEFGASRRNRGEINGPPPDNGGVIAARRGRAGGWSRAFPRTGSGTSRRSVRAREPVSPGNLRDMRCRGIGVPQSRRAIFMRRRRR